MKALAALAEIGFATRDLDVAERELDAGALRAAGDVESATYVELQKARLLALLGRTDEADELLRTLGDSCHLPAGILARAEIFATTGRYREAAELATSLDAGANPLLAGEARRLSRELQRPAFRLLCLGEERLVSLVDIERLKTPYVDTIRRRFGPLDLRRRVAQLELLMALGRGPVTALSLFGRTNESLQARLRVEVSRLRREAGLAINSSEHGFVAPPLGILLPETSSWAALLADGEAWPPRAIAAVLGESVRTVERRLESLVAAGSNSVVLAEGQARSRRWRLAPGVGSIATRLLLLTRPPPA